MRSKSLAVEPDRMVLTEPRAKYLELEMDWGDVSADETDDGDPWGSSSSPTSSRLGTSPSPPSSTASSAASSWKERITFHHGKRRDSTKKDKNEPSRFMGEGVSFKAKLIGILEVAEARGDRMCQDALADLKMAIRAAGEHKQRITINIAIDGLRLRDEKTGDCLYHHLVHKISFIAQDMTDPRAFGYIFGSPDTGHRFFGIKTDKAASQVVECIRDLFQVVFALKNREQHIEQHHLKICGGSTSSLMSSTASVPSVAYMEAMAQQLKETLREHGAAALGPLPSSIKAGDQSSEATIADLLDLEYELNNMQQNIPQADPADHLGSKDDVFGSDPFGDSFTGSSAKAPSTVAPLPPPPSAKDSSRQDGFGTHRRERAVNRAASTASSTAAAPFTSTTAPVSAPLAQEEKHWFDQETEALFDETEQTFQSSSGSRLDQDPNRVSPMEQLRQAAASDQFDVFTELDPLGTGRSKPYVDKKDFFSDLKNPPKKVLKDLVGDGDPLSTSTAPPLFQASFDTGFF